MYDIRSTKPLIYIIYYSYNRNCSLLKVVNEITIATVPKDLAHLSNL